MGFQESLLYPLSKRYVAGKTRNDAIQHVQDLNKDNVKGIVNILGEHLRDMDAIEHTVVLYEDLLEALDREDVDADVSVKLSQLGLLIDEDACQDNVARLAEHADALDRFVWIDMESSQHTEETIDLYTAIAADHNNLGVTIQATLQRSENDLNRVLDVDGTVRLVKGAYDEPESMAYKRPPAIREHYEELMEQLFAEAGHFAVATHDKVLINYAKRLDEEHDRSKHSFEFQSLMGVKDGLERTLADDGYLVGEYAPYGLAWLPYYKRRLAERKHLLFNHLHR